jgi:hypothetical protein
MSSTEATAPQAAMSAETAWQHTNWLAKLFLALASMCGARFTMGESHTHYSLPDSYPLPKGWRPVPVPCVEAEAERQGLSRTAFQLEADLAAAHSEVAELKRLIEGSLRLVHNAGPMLKKLVGTLPYAGPNDTFSAVSWANQDVVVQVNPFAELITISGLGTNVEPLQFHAPGGNLTKQQQELLLGRLGRYRATKDGGIDPVEDKLSLAGAVVGPNGRPSGGEGGA